MAQTKPEDQPTMTKAEIIELPKWQLVRPHLTYYSQNIKIENYMKTKLKVKISLVLSASIIINIFLIWEVFRLRKEINRRDNSSLLESKKLEDLWNENQLGKQN